MRTIHSDMKAGPVRCSCNECGQTFDDSEAFQHHKCAALNARGELQADGSAAYMEDDHDDEAESEEGVIAVSPPAQDIMAATSPLASLAPDEASIGHAPALGATGVASCVPILVLFVRSVF